MLTGESKKQIQQMKKENDGKLPSYAWPGGYPIYYMDEACFVLCPDCANKGEEWSEVIACDLNYEDESLFCEDCGKKIESAYGEE